MQFFFIASLVGILFVKGGWLNLFFGLIIIFIGLFYTSPLFNNPAFYCLGIGTKKNIAIDYMPFFPWFGVVLLGIYTSHLVYKSERWISLLSWNKSIGINKFVSWFGRNSLVIYMVHFPIIGSLMAIIAFLFM